MKFSKWMCGVAVVFVFVFCAVTSATQNSKPITLKGLLDSLKTHGLSNAELTQIVKSRGVDFELNSDTESQLRSAGADNDLVSAVRASYHGAAGPAPDKTPSSDPPPSAPVTPAAPTKPAAPANAPAISSIREVKKLFIEKMPNDLDEYIKTEISRQMPNRIVVVLRMEDADAVMKGSATTGKGNVTITDLRGTAELWDGAAGDKGIYLTKIHGGEKKVAERLVGQLKKAME
jgi:hypothetical protein